jgi:hypothetical protein
VIHKSGAPLSLRLLLDGRWVVLVTKVLCVGGGLGDKACLFRGTVLLVEARVWG